MTRSRVLAYVALAYLAGMVSCVTLMSLGQRMERTAAPGPARTALPSAIPSIAQRQRCPIKIRDDTLTGVFRFINISDRTVVIGKITLNNRYSVSPPFNNYAAGGGEIGALSTGEELWLLPHELLDNAGGSYFRQTMTPVTWRIDTDAGVWRIDWK